jgi:hypothetical protein
MYQDPKHIRKHPKKISLNDDENRLIEMAANLVGIQPSAYIRELAMEQLAQRMEVDLMKKSA